MTRFVKRMARQSVATLAVLVVVWASAARAEVRLPKIFGNSMVLQQNKEIPVWGWAEAGEKVTVTLGEAETTGATTTAGKDGRWMVKLSAQRAGGPHILTIRGKNTVVLDDVLIGEVWVCSGQSNMQWPVQASDRAAEEIAAADHPKIRLFTVARHAAEKPVDDCKGSWSVCSPKTVPGFTAVGYYFGRHLHKQLDVPIGLINTSWGGTLCEAWTSAEGLAGEPDFQPILQRGAPFRAGNPNQASNLYDGMIHPIVPFGIRGAIWYQGESNVSRAEQYAKLFPAMIRDWRKNWGQGDFPFLFVQLAPFRYGRQDPANCAELWEAQLRTLALPATGMAVTTDIGNVRDIHPRNKQDVGKRLALWALGTTYEKKIVYSGPLYEAMKVEGDAIRIRFKHTGGGLMSRDGKPLSDFTIAGADGSFQPATASVEGQDVVVRSDKVGKPAAVRFGWSDTAQPNLANKEGLPASPFRTDDFKRVTAGKK